MTTYRVMMIDLKDPEMAEPIFRFVTSPVERKAWSKYRGKLSMAEYVSRFRFDAFCTWYREHWE